MYDIDMIILYSFLNYMFIDHIFDVVIFMIYDESFTAYLLTLSKSTISFIFDSCIVWER